MKTFLLFCIVGVLKARAAAPALVSGEFIYDRAPFPSCHATTLAETTEGLVAAWFGGTAEGNPDVKIWVSRSIGGQWTPPAAVADGQRSDGRRFPCWNPVLFQPRSGALLLFYKVGPNPERWWGMERSSHNQGETWSEAKPLPAGILGPIKDKPVELPGGDLLCPSSTEGGTPNKWQIHFERRSEDGSRWTATPPLNDGLAIGAIQPTILLLQGGRLMSLARTRQGRIFQTTSSDGGLEWSPLAATDLPNPNSGIDAVSLRDGRQLLVYNATAKGRSPLNVALSDDGKRWRPVLVLESEPGEYSYPAVIQTRDGLVHCTYTWKRQKVRHVVIDPAKL